MAAAERRSRIDLGRRVRHPAFLIVGWFGGAIALGTFLLSLPISNRTRFGGAGTVGVLDAFFTAASAVTVTGLTVVDTGRAWTLFGEMVILGLIQIGGLGILTMAGFFGIALNRRLGVRGGMLAGAEIGLTDLGVLRTLIRDIVRFVFATEAVVLVLLAAGFLRAGHTIGEAFHHGLFHSVSAFNNAGFSTIEGSLEPYVEDAYISLVIVATFVLSGLGFPVVFEVARRWRHPAKWSLHTKVSLAVTAVLLAAGAVVLGAIEWANPATMGSLGWFDKLVASLFASATARTAGFNTVPTGALHSGSLMVLILLMVIGACSASTGGGIKTTTFAVVVRSWLAELRGDTVTTMFSREVSLGQQRQALALVVAALGTVGTATFALTIFQPDLDVVELLFETASAFGTVGLSTGVTTELDLPGRTVLIVLMFIGRVGPTTFGTAVLLRKQRRQYGFPSEELLVG